MADQTSGIYPRPESDGTSDESGATIEAFAAAASGPGLAVAALQPLSALLVQTRNTCYHIIVSRGSEILIQGGSFFPEPTEAHLDGASFGTSLLKVGWIGIGLRMEIRAGDRRIVTTAVRSITPVSLPPRPH
jgi:hypothetical protein